MTAAPKIAVVMISNFGRADGGRETWAYQFIPRLLARNPSLSVDVYGLRIDGQPDNSCELRSTLAPSERPRLGINFFRARRNRIPNAFDMAWAIGRFDWPAKRPALALGVGSFIELLCMLLAPGLRGVPKAVWLRTIFIDEKAHRIAEWLRPIIRAIETAILRRADLIIANGDDTAAHYRARGLDVEVIKNAVQLDRWELPPPKFEAPIDIAFIGRLTDVKGAAEFLALCQRMGEGSGRRPFRFHIVGEGTLTRQALALEAEGRLTMHGIVPNAQVPELLEQIDACVALTFVRSGASQKSGGSGVSNALLEQMAAGRLLICWDNAAFRQVLDENSAYFVRQGDVAELAAVLRQIADNPDEARRRALAGARLAKNYGIDTHMEQFEKAAAKLVLC